MLQAFKSTRCYALDVVSAKIPKKINIRNCEQHPPGATYDVVIMKIPKENGK